METFQSYTQPCNHDGPRRDVAEKIQISTQFYLGRLRVKFKRVCRIYNIDKFDHVPKRS